MRKIGSVHIHGNRKENKIALTFDDGPSEETKKVLKILKKYGAKATFFIWGERINGREIIIEKILKEGHELGNHSYHHIRLWFKSKNYVEEDIRRCDVELEKFGVKTNLFRSPGLSMSYNLLKICKKLKKEFIACDVISNDWKKKGVRYSVMRVLEKTKNGSIINFHDYLEGIGTNEEIIPILEKVLPELRKKYKLVTVSDLLFSSS